MNYNPDATKQAQEVIFTCKTKKLPHPLLVFNNANVTESVYQMHLGIILDSKLAFENHINMVTTKINKTIGLLRKLQNLLPRTSLITIYKVFARPHLVYGDILYDQAFNLSFQQKLEFMQYRACLAITSAIRDTSREKKSHFYIFNLIPEKASSYDKRNVHCIPLIKINHNFFENTFFPSAIIE